VVDLLGGPLHPAQKCGISVIESAGFSVIPTSKEYERAKRELMGRWRDMNHYARAKGAAINRRYEVKGLQGHGV
jgi:hypothetical protein